MYFIKQERRKVWLHGVIASCYMVLQGSIYAQCPVIEAPAVDIAGNSSCSNPGGSIVISSPLPLVDFTFSIDGGVTYQASPSFTGLPGGKYIVIAKSVLSAGCISDTTELLLENPAQFVSTPFSISDAGTPVINNQISSPVVTLPGAPDGIVFDLYRLDNAFTFTVNGVAITSDELQFYMPHPTGVKMEFIDGAAGASSYYGGLSPLAINAIWLLSGNASAPLFRVVISEEGAVSILGARISGGPLYPMRLRTGSFNTVPVHKTAGNTIQLSQSVDFTTHAAGAFNQVVLAPLSIAGISSVVPSCNNPTAGSATVSVAGGRPPYNYLWQNGQTGSTVTGIAPGAHAVTVTDTNACDYRIHLILPASNAVTPPTLINREICRGDTLYGYSTTGVYVDTLTAFNGCDSIRTLRLTVVEEPAPRLPADTTICSSSAVVLQPGTFDTYAWQDGSSLPQYLATQAGLYKVTVTNTCGLASASMLLNTKLCDVFIPSAFSPGSGSANNTFRILNGGVLSQLKLSVYNRFGQVVFATSDPQKVWDGNYKGKPQPAGTYVYYGKYRKYGSAGFTAFKGTVTLLR